jgi:hypothetical protein
MNALRQARDEEAGQAIVLIVAVIAVLIMTVGLAVDAGMLYSARRTMQEAADAGAFAGAVVLYQEGTAGQAISAARDDVERNGYVNGGQAGLTTVTVNHPPFSGSYAGNSSFVEVILETQVRTMILPLPTILTTVRVRAVGGSTPGSTGHAILTLSPNESDAFKISGGGSLDVNGGGVHVNSNANPSLVASGPGSHSASYFRTRGTVAGGEDFTPSAQNTPRLEPDPYANLPGPSTGGLPVFTNTTITSNRTLDPGVYVNGITHNASYTLTLRPGVYILKGGGLQFSGSGTIRVDPAAGANEGVMLFNALSNYPSNGGSCEKLNFSGNGTLDIRAAMTGPYRGMVFYQDADCDKEMYISGAGSTTARGTWYVPNATINIAGDAPLTFTQAQLVSRKLNWSGNGPLTLNYDTGWSATPLVPVLVE